MIPIATDTPIRRTPWVNYGLIVLNVLIFIVDTQMGYAGTRMGGPRERTEIGRFLDQGILMGDEMQLHQFVTHQFLHGGFAHIAGNMLFLWLFGNAVNAKMGHGPYLLFYLAGGVFAATGHAYLNADFGGMIGASGAIAAVTTAYLALFPRSRVTVLYWWFFIGTFELPSMILIVFKMILWDNILVREVVGENNLGNVAFDAHLAGYAFGFTAAAGMLTLRVLPRDQFDIVALWHRWFQRQAMRAAMADPNARARAQFGRVARPVSVDDVNLAGVSDPRQDQITELRKRIAEALAHNDRDTAAAGYEKLMEIDPRQVLSRAHQLDVANQLYTLLRLPQAVAAYEKYLAQYSHSPEANDVELLLGIIYARDLQQYEVAEAHLRQVLERIADKKRQDQCRHWLNVSLRALGRPATEP